MSANPLSVHPAATPQSSPRDAAAPRGTARVSYILATMNRASHLAAALANVREYLTEDDELVIVDGGSTDDTAGVVEQNSDIVARFISEPDRGESHAFNKGILASSGRIIKPLTDDDVLYPEAVHRAVRILTEHPEIDALLCGGESYEANPDGGEPRFLRNIGLREGQPFEKNLHALLFGATCGVGLFLTRPTVAWVGLFDPGFKAVDADIFERLSSSGLNFRYADIKLFRHVTHPHSGMNALPRMVYDVIRIMVRARRFDLLAWWFASSGWRRLRGKSAYETTYRGGDGTWSGELR